jgi:hypothetical protein
MLHVLVRILTRPSTIAALAASLLLVGIKLLFELYPGEFPARGQTEVFTWPVVGAIMTIGLLGLVVERVLSADGRFPEPFTDRAREQRALLIARPVGRAFLATFCGSLSCPSSCAHHRLQEISVSGAAGR